MIYAGIDAGGSSCKCLLLNENNETLARVETDSANYQVVGLDPALAELRKAVRLALEKAGITSLDVLGIGMAGLGRKNDIELIKSRLLPLKGVKEVFITDDGRIAVLGAHGGRPGIAVIAGTGSIVYGLTADDQVIRTGGWGPILGDEGSGFWLGLNALRSIIRADEGRGSGTSLKIPLIRALGITELCELVSFIQQKPLPCKEVAALAPLVVEEMVNGDRVAEKLVAEGLQELALMVQAVNRKINSGMKEVAVMGGLFTNRQLFKTFSQLMADNYGLKIIKPLYSAVYGAVLYGAVKAGKAALLLDKS